MLVATLLLSRCSVIINYTICGVAQSPDCILLQKEGSLVVGVAEVMADVVVDSKIRGESMHSIPYKAHYTDSTTLACPVLCQ